MKGEFLKNLLVTCAGRQRELIRAFTRACEDRRRVIAADMDEWAPAFSAADEALVAPRYTDPDYIGWIEEVCRTRDVGLVIPLHEGELEILERKRSQLESAGVILTGSPHIPVAQLADKWALAKALRANSIPCPETFLASEVVNNGIHFEGPVVVKARRGRGSFGLQSLNSVDEVESVIGPAERDDFVVQPVVKGSEVGLDVVNNFQGRFSGALIRAKLRMRQGETDRAVSIQNPHLEALARRISEFTQHLGIIDVDVWVSDDQPLVLDINVRFGGGYMFSQHAGANVPGAFVHWLEGKDGGEAFLQYAPNVTSQRVMTVQTV